MKIFDFPLIFHWKISDFFDENFSDFENFQNFVRIFFDPKKIFFLGVEKKSWA